LGECIFCRIVEGSEESYRVYEDEVVLVILDKYPVSEGHLLVISKKHFESVHDAEPRVVAHAFTVASAFARIYRVELGAPGVNVATNSGAPAGQVIFHFHIHVIPRWRRGPFIWSERHVLQREEAERVIGKLSPHLKIVEDYLVEAGLKS
jgi:histidine triad (HIT) family protein